SQLGRALAHDRERVRLRDVGDAARLHTLVRLEKDTQLIDLLGCRRVLDVDVDRELALLGVGPGHEPRAEADEDSDEEHPYQHRDGRGDGRREVRADRANRLREHQADPGHSSAYPPRRSSRTSLPASSAITRL